MCKQNGSMMLESKTEIQRLMETPWGYYHNLQNWVCIFLAVSVASWASMKERGSPTEVSPTQLLLDIDKDNVILQRLLGWGKMCQMWLIWFLWERCISFFSQGSSYHCPHTATSEPTSIPGHLMALLSLCFPIQYFVWWTYMLVNNCNVDLKTITLINSKCYQNLGTRPSLYCIFVFGPLILHQWQHDQLMQVLMWSTTHCTQVACRAHFTFTFHPRLGDPWLVQWFFNPEP